MYAQKSMTACQVIHYVMCIEQGSEATSPRRLVRWDAGEATLKTSFYICFVYKYVCMYTIFVPDSQGYQKRASNSLALELQMVSSRHVDAGN